MGTNLVHYVPVFGSTLQDLLIGGDQIGQETLLRFYALHVAVLPAALAVLLVVHIWRVRKDGFAVRRGGTGAFAEDAPTRPPRGRAASRTARPRCRRRRSACACSAWSTASR